MQVTSLGQGQRECLGSSCSSQSGNSERLPPQVWRGVAPQECICIDVERESDHKQTQVRLQATSK